ncbi:MAG: serine/threonine-protein kinase, partial [Planctomycetota bacterium]
CQAKLDDLTNPNTLNGYRSVVLDKLDTNRFFSSSTEAGSIGQLAEFLIIEEIGSGGMGVVFRGRDTKLHRDVAIKLLAQSLRRETVERFQREATTLAKLNHDNILPIYSSGIANDGSPYLVMPMIYGSTLKGQIRTELTNPFDCATWIRDIALGLHSAHELGVIHRDVKPANILIDEADGRAKLMDFGLAKDQYDKTLTQADVISGTPEYMSPEQIVEPQTREPSGDIYSLGIVLYECLTGTPPFRGHPMLVLEQHQNAEPIRPHRLNSSTNKDLETICLKAIQKDRRSRYATAEDLANDLNRFLEGRPILARPAGVAERIGKWSTRNPSLSIAIAMFVLTLIIGTITSTWFAVKSSTHLQLAKQQSEQLTNQTELMQRSIDDFFGKVIDDDSSGMQLSVAFRNQMTYDLAQYYDELIRQSPDDRQLITRICRRILELHPSLAQLQLRSADANLLAFAWSRVEPITLLPDATESESLVAAKVAVALAESSWFTEANFSRWEYD